MSRSLPKLLAATAALTLAALAGAALANSASFSFTMNNRLVNGESNKMLHALDAGELTLDGKLWVTSKKARATAEPGNIEIFVYKIGILNSEVCKVVVTPDRIFNKRVAFSKACGRVESGTYVIKLWKEKALDRSGDGWQIAGSGTLTTK
jgi:hypothetical protein